MNTNLHKKLSLFLLLVIALAPPLHASPIVPEGLEERLEILQDPNIEPWEKKFIVTSFCQAKYKNNEKVIDALVALLNPAVHFFQNAIVVDILLQLNGLSALQNWAQQNKENLGYLSHVFFVVLQTDLVNSKFPATLNDEQYAKNFWALFVFITEEDKSSIKANFACYDFDALAEVLSDSHVTYFAANTYQFIATVDNITPTQKAFLLEEKRKMELMSLEETNPIARYFLRKVLRAFKRIPL